MRDNDDDTVREAELFVRRAEILQRPIDEQLIREALVEDYEVLKELDRAFEGKNPEIRMLYLSACERQGKYGRSFGGYLLILLRRHRLNLAEAAKRLGVKETTLLDWFTEEKIPSHDLVDRILETLPLSKIEAKRLSKHREMLDFEEELDRIGPENYKPTPEGNQSIRDWAARLQKRGQTFGARLELKRALEGCDSAEEMAEYAYVTPEEWSAWEEDRVLPGYREVEALLHLICISSREREQMWELWRKSRPEWGAA